MGRRRASERIEKFFLRIVRDESEAEHGRGVRALLWALRQLSRLYRLTVRLRLLLYIHRIYRDHELGCQVISVGNLTVGGTGKTPVVETIARRLQKAGRKVAILSRGYRKREPSIVARFLDAVLGREKRRPPRVVSDGKSLLLDSNMGGDEPYMLASHLPEVAVLVDRDRVKSGRYAISRLGCDTLVLDDGFQYLSLKHWVEIVLVDSQNPFGNRHVLPRGLLREPVEHIARANYIFITKCRSRDNDQLKAELRRLNSKAEIIECAHSAKYLENVFSGERRSLDLLKGLRVTAMTGIAAPAGFDHELEQLGATIVCRRRFADHHRYSQQELIDVINQSARLRADAILTTEKDAVRFPWIERRDVPVYFLRVAIELLSGKEDLDECISRICFRKQ